MQHSSPVFYILLNGLRVRELERPIRTRGTTLPHAEIGMKTRAPGTHKTSLTDRLRERARKLKRPIVDRPPAKKLAAWGARSYRRKP